MVYTDAAPAVSLSAAPSVFPAGLAADEVTFGVSAGASQWELSSGRITFGDGEWATLDFTLPGGATVRHVYPSPGTYTATVTTTDLGGRASTATVTVTVGDEVKPVTPVVLFNHTVGADATVRAQLPSFSSQTVALSRAVLMNVEVTANTKAGSVTVYGYGQLRPSLAALQFAAGQPGENSVLANAGPGELYNNNSRPVTLAVDLAGAYYTYS